MIRYEITLRVMADDIHHARAMLSALEEATGRGDGEVVEYHVVNQDHHDVTDQVDRMRLGQEL